MAAEQTGDFYKGAYPSYPYNQNTPTTRPTEEKSNRRLVCFKFNSNPSRKFHPKFWKKKKVCVLSWKHVQPHEIWSLVFFFFLLLDWNMFVEMRFLILSCFFPNDIFRVHLDAMVCYAQIVKPLKHHCGVAIKSVNQSAMHADFTTSYTTSTDRLPWRKTPYKWVNLLSHSQTQCNTFEGFSLKASWSFKLWKQFKWLLSCCIGFWILFFTLFY